MRSHSTTDIPAELVRLTVQLAAETTAGAGAFPPMTTAGAGTLPPGATAGAGDGSRSLPGLPADRPWSVPLLVTPEAEAWLLGWPAGLVTPAHGHGGATVAVTVVEGALSEECLDPTIWTTTRRTTWRAGATTLFPPGHAHLLGAAGDRPAVAVHAWSGPAGSGRRAAGRFALAGA